MCLAVTGCVADEAEEFEFGQSTPEPMSGKSDEPTACGEASCPPSLCGYDASVAGEQAVRSCATEDGRPTSFITANVSGGGSFDSRTNPYQPVFSLDNVLVYGCELWDYSDGAYDGLEVEYKELIHASFTVNANDPTRTLKSFGFYIDHFAGPGSYRASAHYQATSEATRAYDRDACSVDVTVDAAGTVGGTFSCSIGVSGSFGCAKNAMNPIFSKWAAAPR